MLRITRKFRKSTTRRSAERSIHDLWKYRRSVIKEVDRLKHLNDLVAKTLRQYQDDQKALDDKFARKFDDLKCRFDKIEKGSTEVLDDISKALKTSEVALEALRRENYVLHEVVIPTMAQEAARRLAYYEAETAIEGYRRGAATPKPSDPG